MASQWTRLIAVTCAVNVLLGLVTMVIGERFFQYRDHRDQLLYDNQKASLSVHNKIEAEQQLEKYGYLHCRLQTRQRRDLFSSLFASLQAQEGGEPSCTSFEVRQAIKQYQKKYNLPETGVIDRRTKKLMSTSRCGNSDKENKGATAADDAAELETANNNDVLQNLLKANPNPDSNTKQISRPSLGDSYKNHPWKRSATDTNLLLKAVTGETAVSASEQSSLVRRKRYLDEYVTRLKSQQNFNSADRDLDSNNKIIHITKRSVAVTEHIEKSNQTNIPRYSDGQKFEKQVIKWRLLESGYSSRIPVEDQRSTLDLAFRMWSEVIPLNFMEETDGDIASVDIEVAFGRGAHQNCKRDFDGHGGEIAHSFSTGNMHFDDDEFFQTMNAHATDGIYLLRVAVHEIGHVLGLIHTEKKYSIMYAIYEKELSGPAFELGWEDRKLVQQYYGVCKGKFNTVFDWVRRNDKGKFIFNTYFFRQQHYWMYENHANRTRYGDPLPITSEWQGIPNEPDGYVHVLYYTVDNVLVDEAYFFKGEDVYRYDNENDRLAKGWPRKISEVFPAKSGTGESIPNNLDSVFFDTRDKNIYFFKNDMVYVYDVLEPKETQGCCVRKVKIQDEFPAVEGSTPLPDNLDAVYYSHINESMYFIKGEDVWQNVLFHVRQIHISNGVKYIGKWYEKWFDICDVSAHSTHTIDFHKT